MVSFIVRILGNAAAIWAAYQLVPGFNVSGGWKQYLIAGLVLAILNATIRPILKKLAFPLIFISLGLFTLVINGLMLWLMDYALGFISIESLTALISATIIISFVNLIASVFAKFV